MPSENVQRAANLIASYVASGRSYKRARRMAIERDPALNNPAILYHGEELARLQRQRGGREATLRTQAARMAKQAEQQEDAEERAGRRPGRTVRGFHRGLWADDQEMMMVRFTPSSDIGEGLEAVNVFVPKIPGQSMEAIYGRVAFELSVHDPYFVGRNRSELYNLIKGAFEAGEAEAFE